LNREIPKHPLKPARFQCGLDANGLHFIGAPVATDQPDGENFERFVAKILHYREKHFGLC